MGTILYRVLLGVYWDYGFRVLGGLGVWVQDSGILRGSMGTHSGANEKARRSDLLPKIHEAHKRYISYSLHS